MKGLVWIKPEKRRLFLQSLVDKAPERTRRALVESLSMRLAMVRAWVMDPDKAAAAWLSDPSPEAKERCKAASSLAVATGLLAALPWTDQAEIGKCASQAYGVCIELARDRQLEQREQQLDLKRRLKRGGDGSVHNLQEAAIDPRG